MRVPKLAKLLVVIGKDKLVIADLLQEPLQLAYGQVWIEEV